MINVNSFVTKSMKINKIRPQDNVFTSRIGDIVLKHEILYYRGKLPEKRLKSVAIVGARKPTRYGEECAYKIGKELAKNGIVIISGLALGIDAMAHRAALDGGGTTIAVLGSGVDDITPRSNYALGERILASGGAIISEYCPGTPAYPTSFLERNRIVSGLADAVIVVEAAAKSGTLSTAAHALGQGRHVFAIPGNINNPMSIGCNRLIKQGAFPLMEVNDVLEVIAPEKMEQMEFEILGDSEAGNQLIKLLRGGMRDGEVLRRELKMSASEFNQMATVMELKGSIRNLGANQWALR